MQYALSPSNDISSNASLLNTVLLHGAMLLPVEVTAFPSPPRRYIWLKGEHARRYRLQRTNGVLQPLFREAEILVDDVHNVLCFYAQARRLHNNTQNISVLPFRQRPTADAGHQHHNKHNFFLL